MRIRHEARGARGLAPPSAAVPVPVWVRLATGSFFLFFCLFVGPHAAEGLPPDNKSLPDPLGYVSDHAGVLEADWKARVRSVCQDLERKTGVEMVAVTVTTLGPYATAHEYAEALYQRWGIGTAQQEHGILVLLVLNERQAAVTVGRNLIPLIPPTVVATIRSQNLAPAFRSGHYGEGLYRAAVALAAAAQEVRAGVPTKQRARGLGIVLTLLTGALALALLWWISRPDLRHPYGRIRRGEFWGSGQGGFGGNFGGFGGGMSGEGLT